MKIGIIRNIILIFLLISVANLTSANQNVRTNIPGTKISCMSLKDFELSRGFVGLESIKFQTSIVFMELPVAPNMNENQFIPFIKSNFNVESLSAKGIKLNETEEVNINNNNAIIFKTAQFAKNIEYSKWIIFIVKDKSIFQIQIASPSNHFQNIESRIHSFISSIQINKKVNNIHLPYAINIPQGWSLAKQFGFMELYNESGKFPMNNKNEAFFGVMNLHEKVKRSDRELWIKYKNTKRNYFSKCNIISTTNAMISGFESNMSVVNCYSEKEQRTVTKFYCYIFLPDTTFLIEADQSSKINKDMFATICKSWKLIP